MKPNFDTYTGPYDTRAIKAYNDSERAMEKAEDVLNRTKDILMQIPEDQLLMEELEEIVTNTTRDIEESLKQGLPRDINKCEKRNCLVRKLMEISSKKCRIMSLIAS